MTVVVETTGQPFLINGQHFSPSSINSHLRGNKTHFNSYGIHKSLQLLPIETQTEFDSYYF